MNYNQEKLNLIKTISEILALQNGYIFDLDKAEADKLVTMREKIISSIDERIIF